MMLAVDWPIKSCRRWNNWLPDRICKYAIFVGTSLVALLSRLSNDSRGITAIEYAVVGSVVAVIGVSVVAVAGNDLSSLYDGISEALQVAVGLGEDTVPPSPDKSESYSGY